MQVYEVAKKIEIINNDLERRGKLLEDFVRSEKLPAAMEEYDKAMEIVVATLRSEGTAATLIKDIAKGRCAEQARKVKQAEMEYRVAVSLISSTETRMSGYQSMNRYLDKMA